MPTISDKKLKELLVGNKLPQIKDKLSKPKGMEDLLIEVPWMIRRIERLEEGLKMTQTYIHDNQCDHTHSEDCLLIEDYLTDFL